LPVIQESMNTKRMVPGLFISIEPYIHICPCSQPWIDIIWTDCIMLIEMECLFLFSEIGFFYLEYESREFLVKYYIRIKWRFNEESYIRVNKGRYN